MGCLPRRARAGGADFSRIRAGRGWERRAGRAARSQGVGTFRVLGRPARPAWAARRNATWPPGPPWPRGINCRGRGARARESEPCKGAPAHGGCSGGAGRSCAALPLAVVVVAQWSGRPRLSCDASELALGPGWDMRSWPCAGLPRHITQCSRDPLSPPFRAWAFQWESLGLLQVRQGHLLCLCCLHRITTWAGLEPASPSDSFQVG